MYETNRPKTYVEWQLGNSCNYKCTYCHEMFRSGDSPFPDQNLIMEVSNELIYHYDELGRDVVFEFIGGEPSLLDRLPDIGMRMHNHPVNIVLKTNGSADLEWWRKMRRYISDVIISVHRDFCDLDHIMEVINFLKNDPNGHEIKVDVLVPVTQREESFNWGVATLKKIRKVHNIGNLQMLYQDFGRGSNTYHPYSDDQWLQYYMLGGRQELNKDVISHRPKHSYKGFMCNSGIETLVIDYKGNVYRGWCQQGGKIGSIFELPLKLPKEHIVCGSEFCHNGFDRRSSKVKI